jgi:hypothetical protein
MIAEFIASVWPGLAIAACVRVVFGSVKKLRKIFQQSNP